MNKAIVATGVVLVLLGGGAVAAMTVADNKIEALYSQNELGLLHNITTTNSDFSFTGGQVDWSAQVVLDPCQPNSAITLSGSDTIRKGLTGYTINSVIMPQLDAESAKFVGDLPPIQVDTHINWAGGGDTDFILPAHEITEENMLLSWADMTGEFEFDKQGDEVVFSGLNFVIPLVSFNVDSISAKLNNVNYSSNIPIGYTLASGESRFVIDGFEMTDSAQGGQVIINDIAVLAEQDVSADSADVNIVYELGGIEATNAGESFAIDDAMIQVSFNGIDRSALESMMEAMQGASKQCLPPEVLMQTLQQPTLEILKAGLEIESNGNHISIGDGEFIADALLTLPAYPYSSVTEAMQILPSQAKYDMTVELDKAFIQGLTAIGEGKSPMVSSSVEENWQTFIDMSGAEVEGDRAIIHKSN